jgi:hypothetical protein
MAALGMCAGAPAAFRTVRIGNDRQGAMRAGDRAAPARPIRRGIALHQARGLRVSCAIG